MPSYDKPTCPQPTKHYLIKKKSRGVKDDGALVKLGDVDLAGKVPIRDLLGKVGEGTKKITEAVTDMLGDSLGLIDNILKKVFSGESSLDKVKKLVTSLVSCGGLWNALEVRLRRPRLRQLPQPHRLSYERRHTYALARRTGLLQPHRLRGGHHPQDGHRRRQVPHRGWQVPQEVGKGAPPAPHSHTPAQEREKERERERGGAPRSPQAAVS